MLRELPKLWPISYSIVITLDFFSFGKCSTVTRIFMEGSKKHLRTVSTSVRMCGFNRARFIEGFVLKAEEFEVSVVQ